MILKKLASPIAETRTIYLSTVPSLATLLSAPDDTFSSCRSTQPELIQALMHHSKTNLMEVCVFYNPQTQTVYKPPQMTTTMPGSWTGVSLDSAVFENDNLRPCIMIHTHPREAVINLLLDRLLAPQTQRILFSAHFQDPNESLDHLIANVMSAVGSALISCHLPSSQDFLTIPDGTKQAVVSAWGGIVYFKQSHGNPALDPDIRNILPSNLDDFFNSFFIDSKLQVGLWDILKETKVLLLLNQNPKEQEKFYRSFLNLCLDNLNLGRIESEYNRVFSPLGYSISSTRQGDTPVSSQALSSEPKQSEIIIGSVLVALIFAVFFGFFVNASIHVDH